MPSLLRLAAGICCGLSAWFSLGVLAFVSRDSQVHSVGLLPPMWSLGLLAAAGSVVAVRWQHIPAGVLVLPILAVLPWLGADHSSLLIWTGPTLLVVWALVVIGGSWSLSWQSLFAQRLYRWGDRTAAAGLLAAIVMLVFAWAVRPVGASGDEPHYLLISTSVLRDGDIDLANDYSEERHLPFYSGPLRPRHVVLSPAGHEYSFHGHGVALLTLPAFALGGLDVARFNFLIISALGLAGLWAAARLASASWSSATAASTALLSATPFLAQSSAIYPEGPGAAIVSFALLTSIRLEGGARLGAWWLAAAGAALALLPWLHLRFSPLAAAFGVTTLWLVWKGRDRVSNALVFLAAPLISASLLFASTWVMFETLDPTAPFRQKASGSLAAAPAGTLGLLADHEYGLIPYAPVFVLAIGGVRSLIRRVPVTAAAALLSFIATLLTGASFVWWGGTSSPARFLVAVLPVVALCLAMWWSRASSWWKALAVGAIGIGAAITMAIAFAERGGYLINAPDGRHSIFEWANAVVDLPSALPSLFRANTGIAQEGTVALLWAVVAAAVFVALSRATRHRRANDSSLASVALVVWITASATGAWMLRGLDPRQNDRAQLELLQSAPRRWLTTGFVEGVGVTSPDDVLSRLRFTAPADPRIVFLAPRVPAGHYRIHVEDEGLASATTFRLELGRGSWPIEKWQGGARAPEFSLALPVHSVRVVADLPGSPAAVRLEVLRVNRSTALPMAQHVTRYGSLDVYALDSGPTMETGGFWLPGNRRTPLVVSERGGNAPPMVLTLESAESATVRVSRGVWVEEHHLLAGGQQAIVVPSSEHFAPLQIEVSGTPIRQAIWAALAIR